MSLITRATNILKSPKTEWDVIAAESANSTGLITGYAVPWSLLSHIAGFIGSAFIGVALTAYAGVHFGMMYWLWSAIIGWVLTLVGLYVSAFVINALAPSFGSTKNDVNAMKLVVYSNTGAWVGGIASIIPVLGWLVALAGNIYSIYIFYLGVPKMMNTPKEKIVSYMVVSAIVMIVVYFVIGTITTAIAGAFFVTSAATIINMN